MCTICLARVFENGSEQKCHEECSSVQDSRTWVEVKLVYMAGFRTGVHMYAICVKAGIFKMRNTL
jgi:hypothetical protein